MGKEGRKDAELALITGASMGLGEEYARQLAARGIDLILTARSEDKLRALADDLKQAAGIATWFHACDLSKPGAAADIADFLERENLKPNWLINNAGFGDAGAFDSLAPDRVRDICMVNIVALTELTSLLLPVLKQAPKGSARVLNLASVAGFQPVPYFGVYSAAKAYVISFSQALFEELAPHNIRVLCVCPSYTATNFAANNGITKKIFTSAQSAPAVVRKSLAASDAGKAVVITRGTWQVELQRLFPRFLIRKTAGAIAKTYKG